MPKVKPSPAPKTADTPPGATRIGREDFLNRLVAVKPGLAGRDILEQSTSFVFRDGEVMTFNEELFCGCKSGLPKGFTGAVVAKPLLDLLGKMDDEFLEVETDDPRKFVLKAAGVHRRLKLAMDPEIRLPVGKVDAPKKWQPLPPDFLDALMLTHNCAGKDEDEFVLTCVHIHPDYLEASDTTQVARYKLKTGLASPVLARRRGLTALPTMDLTESGQTERWLHLRNKDGLRVAVMNHAGEYQYPTQKAAFFLEGTGDPIDLPKSLVKALDRAAVISSENPDADYVHLDLRPGKGLMVKGVAGGSEYTEVKKVKYDGPPLKVAVSPKLMQQIVKEYTSCQITRNKLIVDGDRFRYCAALEDIPAPVAGRND